jgi:hypothetical protein
VSDIIDRAPSQPTRPASWSDVFWRLPSVTVARFTLASHIRSGWILGDLIFVWFLYALFFLEFGGDVRYFYGTAGQGLGALAILSTVVMTQRAFSARVYLPLARLISRSAYVRGVMLASAFLRVPSFLLLLALESGYHEFQPPGIRGATIGNMIPGALGLLANCFVLTALIVAISAPIATRRARIIFFAWLAALLWSRTSPHPISDVLVVTQIPLIPISLCYGMGASGRRDLGGIGGLLGDVALVVLLLLLAEWWLRRRDLILQ